ncbi:phosphoglycolate phosphatase [Thioploca ingrica]|uniref:Phosphoglycolate phosphatase n=1 Tax=Thioploca ingrica TaxID=40754 RepID=A0A090AHZ4_9GAMM|nr:phosphoglycolate phosphatase [Thioploca ingrica]
MTLPVPELVLIDLDGTLIDSVPDLSYAIDGMMLQLELPQRGEEKVRRWIGNGVERLVKRALLDQLEGEPEADLFQAAFHLFKVLYTECNGHHSVLYPQVREGLDWLKSQGYLLACITNKAEQFTIPLLKSLKVYDDFRLVISGDTLPQQKPNPMPLLHAASYFQVNPHHSLMIGDSINDVQAARAAGFQIICVTYGYNHGEDIRTAQPDAVIDSFAQFPQVIGSKL